MGLFFGHVANSLSFIFFGIRWTYCVLVRHLLCRRQASLGKPNVQFRSTIMHPHEFRPGVPIDETLFFIMSVLSIIVEVTLGNLQGFPFVTVAMHCTLMTFYFVSGAVFLLKHFRYITIPDLEYVTFIITFLSTGFFMNVHAQGKSSMEVQIHQYLGYFMTTVGMLLIVEMKFRNSVIATLCRCAATMAQGTWMLLIAFVLYAPFGEPWDGEDKRQMKLVSMMVLWIVLGNILLLFVLLILSTIKVRSMTPPEVTRALDNSYSLLKSSNPDMDEERCKYLLMPSDDEDN